MEEPEQTTLALGEEQERIDAPAEDTPIHEAAPTPTEAELLQSEREKTARLEGELSVLRRQPTAPPPETPRTPAQADSFQQIQSDYDEGKISEDERARRRTALEVDRRFLENQAAAEQAASTNAVREELAQAIDKFPDLAVAGSEMIRDVERELRAMGQMRLDVTDERNHLVAVRKIIALKEAPMRDRRYEQTRHPVGGGGGVSPAETPAGKRDDDKPRGQKIFERMNAEAKRFYMDYHNGDVSKIYSALNHADEGKLMRGGRFA